MRANSLVLLPLIAALGACSGLGTNDMPILDRPKSASFDADLSACRNLARGQSHLNVETGAAAVLGAGIGALAGWADADTTPREGATTGALGGAAMATATAAEKRQTIVINCMIGRGHKVVG